MKRLSLGELGARGRVGHEARPNQVVQTAERRTLIVALDLLDVLGLLLLAFLPRPWLRVVILTR
jgi:hypothetical protein